MMAPPYICPSDPRGLQKFPNWGGSSKDQALTCYLGNSGTVSGTDATTPRANGLLYYASKVKIVMITDGSSNTIMVGERPPNSNLEFGWWFAAYGYDGRGNGDCVMTSNDIAIANYFIDNFGSSQPQCTPKAAKAPLKIGLQPGHPDIGCDAAHYWSFHAQGSHFLFGDGTVRMISYSANGILRDLSTRNGDETVNLPGF
jgi:hypothetical protein